MKNQTVSKFFTLFLLTIWSIHTGAADQPEKNVAQELDDIPEFCVALFLVDDDHKTAVMWTEQYLLDPDIIKFHFRNLTNLKELGVIEEAELLEAVVECKELSK